MTNWIWIENLCSYDDYLVWFVVRSYLHVGVWIAQLRQTVPVLVSAVPYICSDFSQPSSLFDFFLFQCHDRKWFRMKHSPTGTTLPSGRIVPVLAHHKSSMVAYLLLFLFYYYHFFLLLYLFWEIATHFTCQWRQPAWFKSSHFPFLFHVFLLCGCW